MPLVAALRVLSDWRGEQIVVTTMGAAREWPKLSDHPLDFSYLPSSMGQAPMIGLGLALARPEREVIVLNGDGCMWMNLGCLATVVSSGARNYTLIVLENDLYEVTGGQATPPAMHAADLVPIAQGAGFSSIAAFHDLEDWQERHALVLAAPGPRFILLRVAPVEAYQLPTPSPAADRIARFTKALLS